MLYDDQAARFDERAWIPPEVAEAAARALEELAAPIRGQHWLEVGAGTGVLSLPILRLPVRYTGFDRSPGMLAVFREKLAREGVSAELHEADGNGRWPADDGSVSLVFGARALHHLDPEHVAAETRRVLAPSGGWLVAGRTSRPPDSVKAVLRRRMRRLLEAEGYAGRSHDARMDSVFGALQAAGARRLPPREVGRWTTLHRPADSLASWAGKSGLAGLDVPPEVKARVLTELAARAREEYGALDHPLPQEESFELSAVHLPAG